MAEFTVIHGALPTSASQSRAGEHDTRFNTDGQQTNPVTPQRGNLGIRELGAGFERAESSPEQHFSSVHIADPGNNRLVHEQTANRTASAHILRKPAASPSVPVDQRVRSERSQLGLHVVRSENLANHRAAQISAHVLGQQAQTHLADRLRRPHSVELLRPFDLTGTHPPRCPQRSCILPCLPGTVRGAGSVQKIPGTVDPQVDPHSTLTLERQEQVLANGIAFPQLTAADERGTVGKASLG